MFWGWLAIYLISAVPVYLISCKRTGGQPPSPTGYWQFVFPTKALTSISFRDDLKIIAGYVLLNGITLSFKASLQFQVMRLFADWTVQAQSFLQGWNLTFANPMPYLAFVVIFALILDFGNFIGHYFMHKIDLLWQFHKVHHSAEYLLPTTQFRSHPVEPFFKETCMAAISTLLIGVLVSVNAVSLEMITYKDVWLVYMVFYLSFHFRHSHLPISFGPYLSYFFSSPSMHQIHHSIEERHRNKNFAINFSCWDWLFGSIYIPKEKENFEIGLTYKKEQARFKGLLNHLWVPFALVFESKTKKSVRKTVS